eukprot:3358611-Prymnesium_polylepis.1
MHDVIRSVALSMTESPPPCRSRAGERAIREGPVSLSCDRGAELGCESASRSARACRGGWPTEQAE